MNLMFRTIMTTSFFIASTMTYAQGSCSTPIKIEIYDEGSRQAAQLLKKNIASKKVIKVENIVNDQYGYPRRKLPYVHANVTIFSRKGLDSDCVAATVRSLKLMGFKTSKIEYRFYPVGKASTFMRVGLPPRTFLYEYDGTLSVNQ